MGLVAIYGRGFAGSDNGAYLSWRDNSQTTITTVTTITAVLMFWFDCDGRDSRDGDSLQSGRRKPVGGVKSL